MTRASKGPGDVGPDRSEDLTNGFEALAARIPGLSLSMLRGLSDCVLVLTPSGRISFMNRAGRSLLEVDRSSEPVGRDWWDLWPEDNHELIRLAVTRAANREPVSFESVCPTLKGRPVWWEVRVTPLVNAEGDVETLLATMGDLSDLRGSPADDDAGD